MNEGVIMEELMNSVHQHGLCEGDYDIHFTTDEVNKISFHSCWLWTWFCYCHYNV